MLRPRQRRIAADDLASLFAREREQIPVAREVRHRQLGQAALPGSEKLARAAQLQVFFGDHESVATLLHHREPVRGFFRFGVAGDEKTVACRRPSSNPAAKLMELGEAESL